MLELRLLAVIHGLHNRVAIGDLAIWRNEDRRVGFFLIGGRSEFFSDLERLFIGPGDVVRAKVKRHAIDRDAVAKAADVAWLLEHGDVVVAMLR